MSEIPAGMPYPIRKGSKIFVILDGREIELHPLAATLFAKAWQSAVGGAYVAKAMGTDND